MRIVSTVLIILLTTVGAEARTKVAVSGKPLLLPGAASTYPDCSSAGDVVIRVTSPATHGSVSIKRGGVFSTLYPCNGRRVRGTTATYTSRRGYTGPDMVTLDYIFPNGELRQITFDIMVR